jgi:hypothetical protein
MPFDTSHEDPAAGTRRSAVARDFSRDFRSFWAVVPQMQACWRHARANAGLNLREQGAFGACSAPLLASARVSVVVGGGGDFSKSIV